MKYLAGAIVMLAGSLLWATALLATAWMYQAKGNLGSTQLATAGAVVILCVGFGVIVSAARD